MKNAIVIGASSGIGKNIAKQLALLNYKVGITGRRKELLEDLKKENPNVFFVKPFNILHTNSSIQKLNDLGNEMGGLDLLVLSAGTGDLNETLDFEIEKRTIETNVIGFTNITAWAWAFFKAQQRGHLVAITSVGGLSGGRQAPTYNATKAYQINYLEGVQQKASNLKQPIWITDVRPGFVDTDMAKSEGKFWVATVDKATNQIVEAINRKDKIVYITKRWQIIALLLAIIPKSIYNRI